jgi:hypothetical protein
MRRAEFDTCRDEARAIYTVSRCLPEPLGSMLGLAGRRFAARGSAATHERDVAAPHPEGQVAPAAVEQGDDRPDDVPPRLQKALMNIRRCDPQGIPGADMPDVVQSGASA